MKELGIATVVITITLSVLLIACVLQNKCDQREMIQLRETIQQYEERITVYEELFDDLKKPIRLPMPEGRP